MGVADVSRLIPWALPLSLAAGIAGVVLARAGGLIASSLGPLAAADLAFTALYVAWILMELGVARRDASEANASSDRHTRELYGLGQTLTILSALWLGAAHPVVSLAAMAEGAVFLAGVALRWWAILALGRFYSHAARRLEGHRIVDSGPYRRLRHPAYAGMLLAHVGVLLIYPNLVTAVALCGALLPAIVLRIRFEEKVLADVDGYAAFCARRDRLVPFVW
jgi:protein-S-isoprenylcysteine O-methyltransferase Ste14